MRITDWDDAYANRAHVPEAQGLIDAWPQQAAAFRAGLGARSEPDLSYGPGPRNRYDLFRPRGASEGLVVFVHGGYWLAFDKSYWSHYAQGALDAGWTVAIPSYTLAPEARIARIGREVTQAIVAAAGEVPGPIRLVGHSAGGHLVSRAICADSDLTDAVFGRIAHTVSISGLHDLRPLMATDMNTALRLDDAEASGESPALLRPCAGARVTAWVGGEERPEFVRQTTLLANIWTGLGADMAQVKAPGRHHFDVIDGLREAAHPLTRCLLGGMPQDFG